MKQFFTLLFVAGCVATSAAAGLETATFENIDIPEGQEYLAPTDADFSAQSGSFTFNGALFESDGFTWWNGYAFSKITDNNYTSIDDQYMSAPGGAYESTTYAVAFPEQYAIDVDIDGGAVIPGVFLTNSAYTYNAMAVGDNFANKFEQGDWFKLIITGHHADDTITDLDFYLADLRDEDPAKHYIINWWEWVDLTSLGEVTSLSFAFEGTDMSYGYLNTPTYFCLDNLGAERPTPDAIETVAATRASVTVSGNSITVNTDNPDYTLQVYTLDGALRHNARLHGPATVGNLPAGVLIVRVGDEVFRVVSGR